MRQFLKFLVGLSLFVSGSVFALPESASLRQNLEEVKHATNTDSLSQTELIHTLQKTLDLVEQRDYSLDKVRQYQAIIDNYPSLAAALRQALITKKSSSKPVDDSQSSMQLEQEIVQVSSQSLAETRLAQQEQDLVREISDSINQMPDQLAQAKRNLYESTRRLRLQKIAASPLAQARYWLIEAEVAANKARVSELELAQLSANNRLELAKMRANQHQQQLLALDSGLQQLRNQLNTLRQNEAQHVLEQTQALVENSENFPPEINQQLAINRELSNLLNQQAHHMALEATQQQLVANQTQAVHQALSTLNEQAQWLGASPLLGEALRARIAQLPDSPPSRQIENQMAELRLQRLQYEEQLNPLENQTPKPSAYTTLTKEQQLILLKQQGIQKDLLNSLLSGSDSLILELTKLKVATTQLQTALSEVKDATHRYLFWTADINPVTLQYPIQVVKDLSRFLSLDTFGQICKALALLITSKESILPVIAALLLVVASVGSRKHYHAFQAKAAQRVGKVTLDRFTLTLRCVVWSIFVALPLPVLWAALGYGLQQAWSLPTAVAFGDGITAALPMLSIFMICAAFAHPNGLFIVHFRWKPIIVAQVMRYYSLSVGLIVPLIMAFNTLERIDDRQFSSTLARLCFILICISLTIVTKALRRSGLPLYFDRQGSNDNMLNHLLWDIMMIIPAAAAVASCLGYLATSEALLARAEASVAIWFILLIIYHIIRRWMLIQRRRIEFDRARQKRAEMLANRARLSVDDDSPTNSDNSEIIEDPVIDLDTISAQSLRLVRSLLALIALLLLIILWSELNSAFAFLENIQLWDVSATIQGIETTEIITLGQVLIAILVLIVTLQLVRNMPALLELALLQHLSLSPGTGYAITTLTKYSLMIIGMIVGLSMLGIGWAKVQWMVTALGVGLGFGLQQIFANFVSGLILLFEKPIRIGDTVTIRDLTGTVSRINTRATTIIDWDRKEIIVPNQAFVNEQFVNWSLSDPVTRVVLNIPAPADVNSAFVTTQLLDAAARCQYVLKTPPAEAFLVELQQGIQLFELRLFAAEMGHRMPLRHEIHQLILDNFAQYNIELPYPPVQIRIDQIGKAKSKPTVRQTGDL